MKKRDASLKKFLKTKLNTDHLIFKSLRNKVTQQLERQEQTSSSKLLMRQKETLKNYGRVLTNYLEGKNQQINTWWMVVFRMMIGLLGNVLMIII